MSKVFWIVCVVLAWLPVEKAYSSQISRSKLKEGRSLSIKSPVIIVPGTGGSQLEAKLNKPSTQHWYCHKTSSSFFTLWLQKSSLLPWAVNCLVDNMRLVYDKATNTVHNAPGVETRVPGFGQTNTVEYLDTNNLIKYFKPMVDALASWGYERGTSVRAAPYDFRYAPDSADEYFARLRDLIEETYKVNDNKQVTLLSHSLGCPYTLVFLNKQTNEWKRTYIKQWITLSGVWGGSVQLFRLYASGDSFDIPIVNPLTVRSEQRSSTSNNYMLPSEELWSASEVLLKTTNRSYTVKDYAAFFKDVGYPEGYLIRQNVKGLTSPLAQHSPNVTLYCLHGSGVDTPESYTYASGDFPDGAPSVTNGDGDGTVNERSLKACASFKQIPKVTIQDYPGVNHNGILSNENAHDFIRMVLFE